MSSPLLSDIQDHKTVITLNRPEAHNALNRELQRAIDEAVTQFDADPDQRVLIITGAGGKAFSAGADLKELAEFDVPSPFAAGPGKDYMEPLASCSKPVIAAIDGYALAGGLEVALMCDIRIATTASRFGLPEPRRSLLAGKGLHNLSRVIPLGEALLLQLTGGQMTAERAYQIGLVQRLLDDREALLAEAHRIADEVILCAPLAVRAIKRVVKVARNLPVEYSERFAEPFQAIVWGSEDRLEGPRAFVEKRQPVWTGR